MKNPFNIIIIQVYVPTANADEDEMESFYTNIQIDRTAKQDMLIIIGDWNVKVGSKTEPNAAGKFDLGDRNEAGE